MVMNGFCAFLLNFLTDLKFTFELKFFLKNLQNKYCPRSSKGRIFYKLRRAYRIYSNKCRSAYLIFLATSAALIRGRRLFEGGAYLKIVPDKSTFSIFLFNGTLSFYLLIFLWTDLNLIVNLELHGKNSGKRAYRPSREIQSL